MVLCPKCHAEVQTPPVKKWAIRGPADESGAFNEVEIGRFECPNCLTTFRDIIDRRRFTFDGKILSSESHQSAAIETIIRKEAVVKIRCSNCYSLYDETLGKCPNCGARKAQTRRKPESSTKRMIR